jgi:hypothetical protein
MGLLENNKHHHQDKFMTSALEQTVRIEKYGILCCNAVQFGDSPTFQYNMWPLFSAEAVDEAEGSPLRLLLLFAWFALRH